MHNLGIIASHTRDQGQFPHITNSSRSTEGWGYIPANALADRWCPRYWIGCCRCWWGKMVHTTLTPNP